MVGEYYNSRLSGDRIENTISKIPRNDITEDSVIIINQNGSSEYKSLKDLSKRNNIDNTLGLSSNPVTNQAVTVGLNGKISPTNEPQNDQFLYNNSNSVLWVDIASPIQGDSAYKIWLDQGNIGTKTDFLVSLIGAQGDRGEKGDKGEKGATGKEGEQGLKGPAGDKGETGATGARGEQGVSGDYVVSGQFRSGIETDEVLLFESSGTVITFILKRS